MKRLLIRLPDDLHEVLITLAQEERRSLNSELIIRLERSVERDRKRLKKVRGTEKHRRYTTRR